MMELKIQLVPTGEIILSPGKNGESYCNSCSKVSTTHTHTHTHWVTMTMQLLQRGRGKRRGVGAG